MLDPRASQAIRMMGKDGQKPLLFFLSDATCVRSAIILEEEIRGNWNDLGVSFLGQFVFFLIAV